MVTKLRRTRVEYVQTRTGWRWRVTKGEKVLAESREAFDSPEACQAALEVVKYALIYSVPRGGR